MKGEGTDWALIAVIVLLVVQVALFVLSLDAILAISFFCSVTTGASPPIFGFIHLAYLALFFLGVFSLFWQRGRLPYLVAISVALLALPLQVWLLDNDRLQCDWSRATDPIGDVRPLLR